MISNRCLYALRAILELSVREGVGPVTISDIATAQDIPSRFLESILRQLKQGGLTDSVRGKEGGYTLARPSASITVGQVIRLFEGPLITLSTNLSRPKGQPERDVLVGVWRQAEDALASVYDNVDFRDLAEREKSRLLDTAANYSI